MSDSSSRLEPSPERILIRGVNWLGDAVMTTPAIQRLRETYPEAHITLLTHEKLADIWRAHPDVNEVETFGAKEGVGAIAQRLKAKEFDLGIALPNSPRTAFELWRAGIPRRVGYCAPWRNWMLTHAVPRATSVTHMRKRTEAEIRRLIDAPETASDTPVAEGSHHIHHYLRLVEAIGASSVPAAPRIEIPDGDLDSFAEQFIPNGDKKRLWLGLNPGAEYGPAKRWPADRFVAAAVELTRQTDCGWLVFGAKGDNETESIANEIDRQTSAETVVNLVGRTSLAQLCAGLKFCDALLTTDSGPMHVAAAIGTPVVVPFGSTSIELTGPGLPGDSTHQLLTAEAPCAPCFLRECPADFRCMNEISVERVAEATNKLTRQG